MKRILFFVIAACMAFSVSAQTTEDGMKQAIKSFLISEGYNTAKIDSDGDVQFKKEGELYWFEVEKMSKGFYICLNRDYMDASDAKHSAVLEAVNFVTGDYKAGRCYVYNGKIRMQVGFFCNTSAEATRFFDRQMSIINSMHDDLKTKYAEYE